MASTARTAVATTILPLRSRSMAVFAPTATNMYVKQRIPTFYDRDDDDKEVIAIDAKEYDELAEE
jgi:hypothetical protein